MSEVLTEIVVRTTSDVHTSRRRAGFEFNDQAQKVRVTDEELALIKADRYLVLIEKGTSLKNAKEGRRTVEVEAETKDAKTVEMTKEEIIKKLTEKGLIEGKDFMNSQKKSELLNLL